jgi:hypothetical protein
MRVGRRREDVSDAEYVSDAVVVSDAEEVVSDAVIVSDAELDSGAVEEFFALNQLDGAIEDNEVPDPVLYAMVLDIKQAILGHEGLTSALDLNGRVQQVVDVLYRDTGFPMAGKLNDLELGRDVLRLQVYPLFAKAEAGDAQPPVPPPFRHSSGWAKVCFFSCCSMRTDVLV